MSLKTFSIDEVAAACGVSHNRLLDIMRKAKWIIKTQNNTGHVLTMAGRTYGLTTKVGPHPAFPKKEYTTVYFDRNSRERFIEVVQHYNEKQAKKAEQERQYAAKAQANG